MRNPRQLAVAAARRLLYPLVPARKQLPFSYWLYKMSGVSLPELDLLDRFFAGRGVAIDVGANEGMFTYRLSKRFKRVYAFEINEEISGPINLYHPGKITLYSCGLSSTARSAKLFIPVIRGIPLNGWASLNRNNLPDAEQFIEKEVQVRPLDDFNLAEVDFIKIDVEGHEIEVIEGALRTIETSRPVMLVEVQDNHLQFLNNWFANRNFVHCELDSSFDLHRKNCNHLFVPIEKADKIGVTIPERKVNGGAISR